MKKILLLLIFFSILSDQVYTQTCYIDTMDILVFNTSSFKNELESAACNLKNSLPSEFIDQFKVIDHSFYLHIPFTFQGIPPYFEKAKLVASTRSTYYLLIGKQSDASGIFTKFWVDLKLPTTNSFSCLDESKVALIENAILVEVEKKYSQEGRDAEDYAKAEIAGFNYLKTVIDSIKSGECCPVSPEMIKNILLAKGYKKVPMNFKNKPLNRPSEELTTTSNTIEDYAGMLIEIPEMPGYIDMATSLASDLEYASVDGMTAKAIITKNINFCDAQIFERVQNNFNGENIQAYIHCHYWENPDTLKPDTLIAKIEYLVNFQLEEVVITDQAGECGAEQLPTSPGFYNYAITMDNGVYFGYNWNQQWSKGDTVEFGRPNTFDDPTEIVEAEHMWANGGVEYNPFIAPYFLPSWRAWFLQHTESTVVLESWYHLWFTQPGLRLKTEREIAFHQFKYPVPRPSPTSPRNIGTSLNWKCDSEVSRQIHDSPRMNEKLLQVEEIIKSWLMTHYDLEGLFIGETPLSVITSPNLSILWLLPSQLALFGGTQGYKIQVRSLSLLPLNCYNQSATSKRFYCEVFFTVYDNMGVGISDAKRWHPGLVSMWILQHHRNFECDLPPCYVPITDHSSQVFHSFEICIEN